MALELVRAGPPERQHYSQGWNAYCAGLLYNANSTPDWKDGYRACRSAAPIDQRPMP